MRWIRVYKREGQPVFMIFVGKWHRNICRHLRVWKEADNFVEYGGSACSKCVLSKLKDNK